MPANINSAKLKTFAKNQRMSVTDKKLIQTAAKNIDELEAKVAQLEQSFNNKIKLKQNPFVKDLLEKEKLKEKAASKIQIRRINNTLLLKEKKIADLTAIINVTKTKAVNKQDFNKFIGNSVAELQTSFDQASSGSEIDILIRDVEIEASVITESQNNRPVFIIPSRVDMKELGSENFQKIKYSLSIVPKDID
ncbi:MAG: hypothetical protein ISEC1_P0758 [Thiomicrorhabdus sp.]|nr:MAG: hypothetical protein ISEC1_P0758 [Thiomicrorhabdus sp.]